MAYTLYGFKYSFSHLLYLFIYSFIYEWVVLSSQMFFAQVKHDTRSRHVSSDVISVVAKQEFSRDSAQNWLRHPDIKRN
jgi:hypothetical protein